MQIDAHYYALLAFCLALGFKKESAHTLAYASQYVDDAKINRITLNKTPELNTYDRINGKPGFFNMATWHSYLDLKTFNYSAMIHNTIAFHFVPGAAGANFPKKLRTVEKSAIIKSIVTEAKKDPDPVKLGLCLHPYADSFSHHGFSGILSKVNDIEKCKPINRVETTLLEIVAGFGKRLFKKRFDFYFDKAIPAYGHGQALRYPDIPYLKWEYFYDSAPDFSGNYKRATIDNSLRFQNAFQRIGKILADYLELHPEHRENTENLKLPDYLITQLLTHKSLAKRIKGWQKLMIQTNLLSEKDKKILHYDRFYWLKEAFADFSDKRFDNRTVDNAVLNENFRNSRWYRYYLTIKWYKDRFFYYCGENGLNIP